MSLKENDLEKEAVLSLLIFYLNNKNLTEAQRLNVKMNKSKQSVSSINPERQTHYLFLLCCFECTLVL